MSLHMNESKKTAEDNFRAAFDRLKDGNPQILPKGSSVSQNNVAREAGCDPSALKKARHPDLINQIQEWLDTNSPKTPDSKNQITVKQRARNRSLREEIILLRAERDRALTLLVEADAKIFDLTLENSRLETHRSKTNVTPIREIKGAE